MTKVERENKQKEIYEIVDKVIQSTNYIMKLDDITNKVNRERAEQEIEFPFKWNTLRNWIKDYLMETKYYNFDEPVIQDCIVYGIYMENELVYIGKTVRGLEIRKQEHLNNKREEWCTEGGTEFKILFKGESEYEISFIESQLIDMLKPKFNKSSKIEIKSMKRKEESQELRNGLNVFTQVVLKETSLLSKFVDCLLRYERAYKNGDKDDLAIVKEDLSFKLWEYEYDTVRSIIK